MTLVIAVCGSRIPGKGIQRVGFNSVPFTLRTTGGVWQGKCCGPWKGTLVDLGRGAQPWLPPSWGQLCRAASGCRCWGLSGRAPRPRRAGAALRPCRELRLRCLAGVGTNALLPPGRGESSGASAVPQQLHQHLQAGAGSAQRWPAGRLHGRTGSLAAPCLPRGSPAAPWCVPKNKL